MKDTALMKVSECRTPAELNTLAELLEEENALLKDEVFGLKKMMLKWMLK